MKWMLARRHSGALLLAGWCFFALAAHAQNATWSLTPGPGNIFNTPSNWNPAHVPTGTAFFGSIAPNGVTVLFFSNTTLGQIQFNSGAPAYSFGIVAPNILTFTGTGITNLSSVAKQFVPSAGSTLVFDNGSTAGNSTIRYSNRGGAIVFNNEEP